jgi:4-amino-4-deoxy-L-arabinose transferase-like glycosyltransferase
MTLTAPGTSLSASAVVPALHAQRPHKRLCLALFCGLLLLYWGVSLTNLAVVPRVYQDEPWQASTGWKLAAEGVFGSDMFQGWYGMERRYYGYMPIHPLFLAATFRLTGLGLFQARFEPVVMGSVTLALTYGLGRRLWGPTVGVLAVAFMLLVRLTGLTYIQPSGILLLDMARISRYDMVVPVFGLASLHAYISARQARTRRTRLYALTGLLAGLAGLSHLYGAFWLAALVLLALWDGGGWRNLAALLLGFAAPWLLYAAYVLGDVEAWRGQTREYGPRFDLLNPGWYWTNLVQERRRYGPGLGPLGWQYLSRPGFWAALVALPLSLFALLRRAVRQDDRVARAIVVPALVLPTLFAFLLILKLVNYTVTILPLGAVAVAWGVVSLWRRLERDRTRWAQVLLAALGVLVAAEGVTRIAALQGASATTTPYADFIAQVRNYIAPGSRVLGLQDYWFGLDDMDYRAWPVPIWQSDPRYLSPPIPLDEALTAISPDVILLDPRIRAPFENNRELGEVFEGWMEREGYELAGVVEDPTYGPVEIFKVVR